MQQPTPATGVVVGVDTHKHTHTAVALDALGTRLGAMTAPVSPADTAGSRPGRAPSAP